MKLNKLRIVQNAAFTLVELMVVMTIIAIMAGVALPVFQNVQGAARMNAAMQQGRQIGLALMSYASDNEGFYPQGENSYDEPIVTSNDAFRSLVPDYVDNEDLFTVNSSVYGAKADNKIGTPDKILQPGENHYAYMAGLSSNSRSTSPLVVDGTDGAGYYNRNTQAKGGTWAGKKAVVVRTDASAILVPLKGTDERRFIPDTEDESLNMLEVIQASGENVQLLDPAS